MIDCTYLYRKLARRCVYFDLPLWAEIDGLFASWLSKRRSIRLPVAVSRSTPLAQEVGSANRSLQTPLVHSQNSPGATNDDRAPSSAGCLANQPYSKKKRTCRRPWFARRSTQAKMTKRSGKFTNFHLPTCRKNLRDCITASSFPSWFSKLNFQILRSLLRRIETRAGTAPQSRAALQVARAQTRIRRRVLQHHRIAKTFNQNCVPVPWVDPASSQVAADQFSWEQCDWKSAEKERISKSGTFVSARLFDVLAQSLPSRISCQCVITTATKTEKRWQSWTCNASIANDSRQPADRCPAGHARGY